MKSLFTILIVLLFSLSSCSYEEEVILENGKIITVVDVHNYKNIDSNIIIRESTSKEFGVYYTIEGIDLGQNFKDTNITNAIGEPISIVYHKAKFVDYE